MKILNFAAASLNQTPRDWIGNFNNIIEALRQAHENKVDVLCLPEMCICGYGLEDDFYSEDVVNRSQFFLFKILDEATKLSEKYNHKMFFCLGLPLIVNNNIYNAVASICFSGFAKKYRLAGFVCKQNLAGDGVHYEPRHFKAWEPSFSTDIAIDGWTYPIGDLIFEVDGVKIGYEICEDAWVANRPGSRLALRDVDVILNPSASHFSFDKYKIRERFVIEGSRAFNAVYVYSNLVGNEAGRIIYDGGNMIASNGVLIDIGDRFSFKDVDITSAKLDISINNTSRRMTNSYNSSLSLKDEDCIIIPNFTFKGHANITPPNPATSPLNCKFFDSVDVISLGLMDYLRKSKMNGFVISLSGGADSAIVSYLCHSGINKALSIYSPEEFHKRYCPNLPLPPKMESVWDYIKYYSRKLITTMYQATAQSSDSTKEIARKVAEGIHSTHYEIDVDPIYAQYKNIMENVLDQKFDFNSNSITLQNLQARVRSPSIWLIANHEKKLLLTTSNMSEVAVGYCTMDGDTSGAIAPIAGLSKTFIRGLVKHLIYMIPDFKLIYDSNPTAELLPQEFNQTDESDLMPYEILHQIEKLFIKNRYGLIDIYTDLKYVFGSKNLPDEKLKEYVVKFVRLFSRSQWKRERYALSFHLDDHNLDPRTWCRAPILSGNYEVEIEELMKYSG